VQDGDQAERDRPVEVQGLGGLFQDAGRIPQIGVDVVRTPLGPARQQGTRVREHDRVVVDVHHPRVGRDALRDLVHVLGGRQSRADVEELPDTVLLHQRGHRAAQEVAVVPYVEVPARIGGERGGGRVPVGRVVVLATEEDVVDAGRMCLAAVDPPLQLGGILAEGVTGHGRLPEE
jgi:hypothetical protein